MKVAHGLTTSRAVEPGRCAVRGAGILALVLTLLRLAHAQTVISPVIAQVYGGGEVDVIAVQADGKVLLGGVFDHINGVPRNHIARLNANGSLDTAWNPDADGAVTTIALGSSGQIYVGGGFQNIGGKSRAGIALLSPTDGTADPTWNPAPALSYPFSSASVASIVPDGSGNLYVLGYFSQIGGQARNSIAKLSGSGAGAADAAWYPIIAPAVTVQALAPDGAGHVYLGGNFSSVNGQPRQALARVSASGTGALDAAWNPLLSCSSGASTDACARVHGIAFDASGNVYITGYFFYINGQQWACCVARLSPNGSGALDGSWNVQTGGESYALLISGPDVYVGGVFDYVITNGTSTPIAGLARISNGTLATSWVPFPGNFSYIEGYTGIEGINPVYSLTVDGGSLLVGGSFVQIGGLTRTGFGKLSLTTAAADPTWPSAQLPGLVTAVARDGSQRTVIGGSFQFMGDGTTIRNGIARLNADGSLDTTWDPEALGHGAGNNAAGVVSTIAQDGSGNLYVGGSFLSIGGQARNNLAKLSPMGTGAADATWNPGPDAPVHVAALDGGGNAYVGGEFANVGGKPRSYLAKLNAGGSGAADSTWDAGVAPYSGRYGSVGALALDASGDLFVGGFFGSVGGLARNSLAKVSASGSGAVDANWDPGPDALSGIAALVLDGTSQIYAGGSFENIGGKAIGGIARLATTGAGAVDPSFNLGLLGNVKAIVLDASANVYLGGEFGAVSGARRVELAKVSSSGAADCHWIAPASYDPYALALDASGDLYVGGYFTTIAGATRYGYAELAPGTTPACSLVVTQVNNGLSPSATQAFDVVVSSQDAAGYAQPVATATTAALSVHSGTGTLGGTLTCQIPAAASSCTVQGVTYSTAESGVSLTASATSGDALLATNSAPFSVISALQPTRLAVVSVNAGANPTANAPFSAVVQAQDDSGIPRDVPMAVSTGLSLVAGTGVFSTAGVGCTIPAGSSSCTITGNVYSKAETGVIVAALAPYGSGYLAGDSQPFTVVDAANQRTLTILNNAPATSSPPGISCPGTCTAVFAAGTPITLTATGSPGPGFSWGGACSGSNPTCNLTLNSDSVVIENGSLGSCTVFSTTSTATEAPTTITGNSTARVDIPQTHVLGRYQSATVYDKTIDAPAPDPAVAAAFAAAAVAVEQAAPGASEVVGPPVLTGTASILQSSQQSYDDTVSFGVNAEVVTTVGPNAMHVGSLGLCANPPTQCALPVVAEVLPAGCEDIDTLVISTFQTSRTLVTTNTYVDLATYIVGSTQPASDASLSQLTLSSGTLSPAFAPTTLGYASTTNDDTTHASVTPVPEDPAATVTVNGLSVSNGNASFPVPLHYGVQAIAITVTAQDGVTQQTYTVNVDRSDTIFEDDFDGDGL